MPDKSGHLWKLDLGHITINLSNPPHNYGGHNQSYK